MNLQNKVIDTTFLTNAKTDIWNYTSETKINWYVYY